MGKTLVDILHVNRYAAQAVTSGDEALQLVVSQSFDCVLTDIRMPEMNGVQLFRRLQQLQPRLPVVLMTAYATGELIDAALAEGAVAILKKPLDIPRLLVFLERLATPAGITIIDADADLCARLASILWEAGFLVTIQHDLERLHSAIHAETQVILLD
jgi:CheY-like chemotaxis protein